MPLNEFRQDIVSGEWVLFSATRGKRPIPKVRQTLYQSPLDCPFEDPFNGEEEVMLTYPNKENWQIAVIKNKFPALQRGQCLPEENIGPYKKHAAVGEHDLVIYRDHDKAFDEFSKEDIL